MRKSGCLLIASALAAAAPLVARADDDWDGTCANAVSAARTQKDYLIAIFATERPQPVTRKDAKALFDGASAVIVPDQLDGRWKQVFIQGGTGSEQTADGAIQRGHTSSADLYISYLDGKIDRIGNYSFDEADPPPPGETDESESAFRWETHSIEVTGPDLRYEYHWESSDSVDKDDGKTACRLIGVDFLVCRKDAILTHDGGSKITASVAYYSGYVRSHDGAR